ncbi:hypothetical protein BW716_21605 [[Flexibacter] sp. ATCC 35208]|nr:hypothetical protein BW716_21605 [[Flexibacter] sp. ATCC 35208]
MSNLTQAVKNILLADDDLDDNVVFMDVVNEIDNQINVSIVNDGEELIIGYRINHDQPGCL